MTHLTDVQIAAILAYLREEIIKDGLANAISNVAAAIIAEEARQAAELISAESPDIAGLVVEWVNGIPDRVIGIAAVTLDQVRRVLTHSLESGDTLAETVEKVSDLFIGMEYGRAKTIAVTEVQGASNFAAWATFKRAGVPFKRWLAVGDERTRESHAEINGAIQAIDIPFVVGGYEMMYPADPKGPAHEVINCRCWLIPEFARALLKTVWRIVNLKAVGRAFLQRSSVWETHMENALRDEFSKQRNHVLSLLK